MASGRAALLFPKTVPLRAAVALIVVAAALRLFLPPRPIEGAADLAAWFGLGVGIGLVLGRWWALLLAPLPWLGIWYTRATGPEYLSRPNDFPQWLSLTIIALPGLVGIALGVGARRALAGVTSGKLAERRVLLSALVVLLGAAVLDWGLGQHFLRPVRPLTPPRYSEADVRAAATGLAFPVYAAPPSEGAPSGLLRRPFAPPGLGPTETLTLIYCDERCRQSSKVQIMSAPPEFGPATRQRGGSASKPDPIPPTEAVEIAGVTWQLLGREPRTGPVTADTILGDAYVRIHAPTRAHFERVAVGLRRIDR